MKNLICAVVVLLLLAVCKIEAQNFQGIATYKSHRKIDFKMGDDDTNSERQKMIKEKLKKQFQKEYTLKFNAYESLYKEVEKLDTPQFPTDDIMIKVVQGSDILYKNVKTKRYVNQTEILGKRFLVKDSLNIRNWVLTGETKHIGVYTCYKAEFEDEYTVKTVNKTGELATVTEPRITSVWYTPEIPVSHGPANFYGLPGLILEVNNGKLTLVCSKIVMNPEMLIEIVEPDKGTIVSQNEYNEIQEKKTEEMTEKFRSEGRRGENGDRVMIRIGG